MKNPSISIIIPVYNEDANISNCLGALCPQLLGGDEIIVVDNNCTDNTAIIAKAYAGVRVLRESRQGQVFAQATGFDRAKCTVLARIDADTVVTEGWLSGLRKAFKSEDTHAVTGPGVAYDTRMGAIEARSMSFWTFRTNRLISGHYPLWGSNFAMTAELWRQVGSQMSYRSDIWEDFELSNILHSCGFSIDYLPTLVVGYSSRRAINAKAWPAICYQYRACRTYWHTQSKLVSVLSFFERTLMLIAVSPGYLIIEPYLRYKRQGLATTSRPKA